MLSFACISLPGFYISTTYKLPSSHPANRNPCIVSIAIDLIVYLSGIINLVIKLG